MKVQDPIPGFFSPPQPPSADSQLKKSHNLRDLIEILVQDYTPAQAKIHLRQGLGWKPSTDVFETDDEFVVVMDIAGMDPKDFRVQIDERILTISGVRDKIQPRGKKHFHKMEVSVGPFERNIHVPVPVASDKILARYQNGVLEVRLKKSAGEKGGPVSIPVE